MFAKSAVFFFAFVAFANAAPVVDSDAHLGVGPVDVWNSIELGPGPFQFQPVQDTPSKRGTSLNLNTDSVDVHLGSDGLSVTDPNGIRLNGALPQLRRASTLYLDTDPVDVNLDSDGVAITGTLPHLTRRGATDLDTFTNQLINAFGTDQNVGIYQGQDVTSNGYESGNV